MPVAVRVIPCLDVDGGRVVKGVNFRDLRDAGDPVELAAAYDAEGADELVFLDITASAQRRDTMVDVVARTADQVFIPLTVGGGVRNTSDVDLLLRAGADKVSLNTAAVARPELLTEVAGRFGAQCVVVSVDARRTVPPRGDDPRRPPRTLLPRGDDPPRPPRTLLSRGDTARPGAALPRGRPPDPHGPDPDGPKPPRGGHSGFEVTTHGGRRGTGLDAVVWAHRAVQLGAGEILLNSMDTDGTQGGFDLELIAAVRAVVDVPVIASGGAGRVADFAPAVAAGADAVLAASVFHFGEIKIGEVKESLRAAGHPVR